MCGYKGNVNPEWKITNEHDIFRATIRSDNVTKQLTLSLADMIFFEGILSSSDGSGDFASYILLKSICSTINRWDLTLY